MFLRQYTKRESGARVAYWALVESFRTPRGPRQRIVAWLGKLDEAGRLGVREAAQSARGEESSSTWKDRAAQQFLFDEDTLEPEPR